VDNEVRQTSDMAFSPPSPEGMSPEISRVRNVLFGLPRMGCPVGFEFRLQRRLDELENGVRPLRERHGWGLGWAGLGLGLATALLVAVVMFDFSFSPKAIRMPGAPVARATNESQRVTPGAADPLLVSSPQQVLPDAEATTVHERSSQMAAAEDSNAAKIPPTTLPENLFHTVGGNSP